MPKKAVVPYNPLDVSVIVNGTYLTGFAEGSFVVCSQSEDGYTTSVGAQGDVSVSITHNPLGTITVTLQHDSPYVGYLDRIAAAKTIVSLWVLYNGRPKKKTGGTQAMIRRAANVTYSDNAPDSNRSYDFDVFDYSNSET